MTPMLIVVNTSVQSVGRSAFRDRTQPVCPLPSPSPSARIHARCAASAFVACVHVHARGRLVGEYQAIDATPPSQANLRGRCVVACYAASVSAG